MYQQLRHSLLELRQNSVLKAVMETQESICDSRFPHGFPKNTEERLGWSHEWTAAKPTGLVSERLSWTVLSLHV